MQCTRRWLLLALFLAGFVGLQSALGEDKKDAQGFTQLFNGKDMTGWKTQFGPKDKDHDPAKTWTVVNGEIHCTGKPNGYFYTEKSYKNYVLSYDWKYIQPAPGEKSSFNSGALVHIQEHKVWPKCIEVQGANANHGFLYFLGAKKIGEAKWDKAAKDKATHPIGEWNTTEITCAADGTITAKINGTDVTAGKSDLTEGQIGFQSEGAEIYFRNIKIKELK
jgi:hypothetical protein